MTAAQIISDIHELTLWLKRKFGRPRIFLLGHSWGSYIGLRAVRRFPCDYYAYVGVGQVADQQWSEVLSYAFTLEHARKVGHREAVRELEAIGPPVEGWYAGGLDAFGVQRKWVREFGGAAHGMGNRDALLLFAAPLIRFPAYTMMQKFSYLQAESFSMKYLERPMLQYRLSEEVQRVHVPVFFFQGRYDQQTVTSVSKEYFDLLAAPHKEFILFEHSAHLVPYEEPERFHRMLLERVRPFEARPSSELCE